MPWEVAGGTRRGAAHIRRNIVNQDAFAYNRLDGPQGPGFVLAVADGHGAEPHFKSDVGARIAVEAAVNLFQQTPAADADPAQFIEPVLGYWRRNVITHATSSLSEEDGWLETDADTFLAYGTTLIIAAGSAEHLFALQIGDGDCMVGLADGRIVRPLPDDKGLIGEQTYSLCSQDAPNRFRFGRFSAADYRAPIDFVMLSTDGLAKSFVSDDAFNNVARQTRTSLKTNGTAAVIAGLDDWLDTVSSRGSGDDVTICFAHRFDEAVTEQLGATVIGTGS